MTKTPAQDERKAIGDDVGRTSFRGARRKMARDLKNETDLRDVYRSNIAMFLHDHYGITDYEKRNAAAEGIIKLVFES